MDVEYEAANLAIRYLRKMAQWNKGLIDLTVPGTDPPARMTDEEIARKLQESYDKEATAQGRETALSSKSDEALALKLQSTYDREHSVLAHAERFSAKRNRTSKSKRAHEAKKGKIEYFLKK